jgi:hypothetical protein
MGFASRLSSVQVARRLQDGKLVWGSIRFLADSKGKEGQIADCACLLDVMVRTEQEDLRGS